MPASPMEYGERRGRRTARMGSSLGLTELRQGDGRVYRDPPMIWRSRRPATFRPLRTVSDAIVGTVRRASGVAPSHRRATCAPDRRTASVTSRNRGADPDARSRMVMRRPAARAAAGGAQTVELVLDERIRAAL